MEFVVLEVTSNYLLANGVDDGSSVDDVFCVCKVGESQSVIEGVYWPDWVIVWVG